MRIYRGQSINGGIAKGMIYIFSRTPCPVRRYHIESSLEESKRFDRACDIAKEELGKLFEKATACINEKDARIFSTQISMLEDDGFTELVYNFISDQMINAETAVAQTAEILSQLISSSENEYIETKTYDITDISERVIRILLGIKKSELMTDKPSIIVANDIHPSEIVMFDSSKILGLVLKNGSVNSHASILARSIGFPAMINSDIDVQNIKNGSYGVIDGDEGVFYSDPDKNTMEHYNCGDFSIFKRA